MVVFILLNLSSNPEERWAEGDISGYHATSKKSTKTAAGKLLIDGIILH
jgi:hypothetical protein